MTGFMTVLTTETLRRRRVLVVALGIGLLPLIIPYLFGISPQRIPEARIALVLFAEIFPVVLAFLLGLSLLGGDQVNGELTFWLGRPVSLLSLWSGRVTASLILVFGAATLILLPTLVLTGGPATLRQQLRTTPLPGAAVVLGIVLFLLALGHLFRIMASDRSPWLIADLLSIGSLATLTGILGWSQWHTVSFRSSGTVELPSNAQGLWALAIVTVALLVGSALQLTQGRWNIRRGHRFMAGTLLAFLLPFTAWHTYASLHPPVPSLDQLATVEYAGPSPDQRWLVLGGQAAKDPRLDEILLVSSRPGPVKRLGRGILFAPVFSADSSLVAWQTWTRNGREVYTLKLGDPLPDPQLLGSFPMHQGARFSLSLSPKGTKMALFRDQTIELVDLVRRRSLGRYEGLPHDNRSAFFVDEDHLRIYLGDTGRSRPVEGIEIFGLDIEKRNLERLGNLPELLAHRQLVASPDGQRLLIRGPAGTPQLRDGRTGALLADLNAAATSKDGSSRYDLLASFWGFFLADGRAIIHSPSPKAEILEVFSVDGELLRRFELAPASTLVFQTEWAPGRVLIRFRAPGAKTGNWSLTEVNVATGKVRPLGDDHRSKSEPWVAYTPRAWFPPANEERASGFFLLRDQGRVSWLNPDTGQNIVFWEGNSKK